MSLAEPSWLLWLPLVAVLGLVIAGFAALHRRALRALFSRHVFGQVLPISVRARRVVRDVAAVAALGLALVALAEPRFDKQIRTVKTEGTDIVILLDLSRSMDARDVDPSRLERARRELRDLGRLAAGDRFGLVVFAGGAYPRLPLTQDFGAVELVVGETDTSTFESQGSALGQAIRVGVELLARSQEQAGQALLVLSDGETHDPEHAMLAAQEALAAAIPIYVVGIGIEPAPIPLPNGSLLTYEGRTAETVPDFDTLEEVARLTGGAFVQSTASDRDMEALYTEIRRNVRAVERKTQQRETWKSAYQWPLAGAVALLLLAGWIGDGRRPFGAAALVILALGLGVARPAAAADPLLEADRAFRAGEYQRAVEALTELSLEEPDNFDVLDRLGAARYRAGDFEGAARAYDQASELAPGNADAAYNAGNAHYQAGRLERAVQRYRDALDRDGGHRGAARNQQFVEQEIVLRRQAPPPPPPRQGDSEEEPQDQGQNPNDLENESDSDGETEEPEEGAQEAEPKPGDASQPPGEGEEQQVASEAVGTQELNETGRPQEQAEAGEEGEAAGPITEGQAHRLLDAVEEGSQRITVSGTWEKKPW